MSRPQDLSASWFYVGDRSEPAQPEERPESVAEDPLGESYAAVEANETDLPAPTAPSPPLAAETARVGAKTSPLAAAPAATRSPTKTAATPASPSVASAEHSVVGGRFARAAASVPPELERFVRTAREEIASLVTSFASRCIKATRWEACVLGLFAGGMLASLVAALRQPYAAAPVLLTARREMDIRRIALSNEYGLRRSGGLYRP